MPEPYPENVPGDFYVERDCCTLCDIPRTIAPQLFAYAKGTDGYDHCYVAKQPSNDAELAAMLEVIQCAELQCIHYCGSNHSILERLEAMGESAVCDALPKSPPKPSRSWWRFW
jgi:hypothetical protein